jgi:PAS domain S-box-containing protein
MVQYFGSLSAGGFTERGGNHTMVNRKILIIDGEPQIAIERRASLVGFGYEVTGIASSGREAIALVKQTAPNLILMDIALQGDWDGIETAAEIHKHWPLPIIYLTTDTDEATLQRAKLTRPSGYLVKPVTERELKANIELALYKDEAIRRERELEERFFAVSIDMLCFLDFNGYFRRLSRAWEKTLGFSLEELQSNPFIEFVHPDDRERTLNQNREVRAGGQARSFENRYLCKDGSYKWLLWNSVPDPEHRIIYAVARDITESRQAQEKREQLVRDLQAALAEVKTLQEILPICSYCKKIRNDKNYWQTVDTYISQHTNTRFSHSICPTCYQNEVEPQLQKKDGL